LANSLEGPGKLYPIKCDVSKEEDILNAFAEVKKKLGGVDILVNNAGVLHETLLSGITLNYFCTERLNRCSGSLRIAESLRLNC
jgi:NAD(P)-dependent dehydrogenase (short-subunit alcohol dehydrogenase family)